jgi:hypothetical protein
MVRHDRDRSLGPAQERVREAEPEEAACALVPTGQDDLRRVVGLVVELGAPAAADAVRVVAPLAAHAHLVVGDLRRGALPESHVAGPRDLGAEEAAQRSMIAGGEQAPARVHELGQRAQLGVGEPRGRVRGPVCCGPTTEDALGDSEEPDLVVHPGSEVIRVVELQLRDPADDAGLAVHHLRRGRGADVTERDPEARVPAGHVEERPDEGREAEAVLGEVEAVGDEEDLDVAGPEERPEDARLQMELVDELVPYFDEALVLVGQQAEVRRHVIPLSLRPGERSGRPRRRGGHRNARDGSGDGTLQLVAPQ